MSRFEEKQKVVEDIKTKFQNSTGVVLADYRGLTVTQVTDLRAQLREAGVEYRVLKNTMVRRAADELGIEGLDEFGGASISNIKDIKTLCVELHETSIDMLCGMNDYGINLNTDINEIKIIAMKLIDKYEEKGEII